MTSTVSDAGAAAAPVVPLVPTPLAVLGLADVQLAGGFWGDRQSLNSEAIIPHCLKWEDAVGWFDNFDAVLDGTIVDRRTGREFSDSDVYKLLEAIAWELGRSPDPDLEARYDAIVARIGAVQREDGYLNTRFGNPGQEPRYSDFEWGHELYNFGHLMQAAVARLRTGRTVEDPLVAIALRVADHVCVEFGADGRAVVGGHPEVEVALVELYRATGEQRYLDQARLFLDRRGRRTLADIEFGRSYFQDDEPLRESEVLRGHAVRALYLAAGAIDAAHESHDEELMAAVTAQYHRALARRTYITGGMGSHHQDEAFGADFELPSDRAYCETCAGIGSVMVAWRLLLTTGDLSYADVIERTLFNVVATSPAQDGQAFFYTNTLHQRTAGREADPDRVSPRALDLGRAAWFEVSCCPTNVARTLAQLGTYVATASEAGVQVLQYASGRIRTRLPGGDTVALDVTTQYPYDGRVRVEVVEAPARAWELTLRVPAWAEGATLDLHDGQGPVAVAAPAASSVREWRAGDVVELVLPLQPRLLFPDPRVDAVRGCVAVQRGPLVLCAESVDQQGGADVARLTIDATAPLVPADGGGAVASGWLAELPADVDAPYATGRPAPAATPVRIPLVPYHAWANRGPSTMRIWIPEGGPGARGGDDARA